MCIKPSENLHKVTTAMAQQLTRQTSWDPANSNNESRFNWTRTFSGTFSTRP